MPTAYSYIRFSTPDQIKGDSLRRQLDASRRYAAEHGLTLDENLTVRDLGVSAFKGKNFEAGELGQFIAAIDSGRIASDSYLLVESLDRISRLPPYDAMSILQSIINRGVTLVTLTDSAVYSRKGLTTDWVRLVVALASMSRAHEESAVKSERVRAAWAAKKVRVTTNKEIMPGRSHWWLRISDDGVSYEIVEDKAEIVRLIFALAKDGMGNTVLAKYLNQKGIPTPFSAKLWQNSTLQYMLRNVAVIGVLQLDQDNSGRTTTDTFVEDYYPAAVDKALFYEVQQIRTARKRQGIAASGGRKGMCYNIFQGTARCGYCSGPVHIRRKPGINSGFLYCAKSLMGGGCVGVSYNLRNLEAEFLSFTSEIDIALVLGDTSSYERLGSKKAELALCIGELADREQKLANLLSALELGGDIAVLVQRLRNLQDEVSTLKRQRMELQSDVQTLSNVAPNDQAFLDNMSRLLTELNAKDVDLDEKFRIRFRLLSEVQKVVRRLDLFPGGTWDSPEKLVALATALREDGYNDGRIDAFIQTMSTKPNRDDRFFIAYLRNGIERVVKGGKVLLETDRSLGSKACSLIEEAKRRTLEKKTGGS